MYILKVENLPRFSTQNILCWRESSTDSSTHVDCYVETNLRPICFNSSQIIRSLRLDVLKNLRPILQHLESKDFISAHTKHLEIRKPPSKSHCFWIVMPLWADANTVKSHCYRKVIALWRRFLEWDRHSPILIGKLCHYAVVILGSDEEMVVYWGYFSWFRSIRRSYFSWCDWVTGYF